LMAKCHLQPDKSPVYLAVTLNSFINCIGAAKTLFCEIRPSKRALSQIGRLKGMRWQFRHPTSLAFNNLIRGPFRPANRRSQKTKIFLPEDDQGLNEAIWSLRPKAPPQKPISLLLLCLLNHPCSLP